MRMEENPESEGKVGQGWCVVERLSRPPHLEEENRILGMQSDEMLLFLPGKWLAVW